MAVTLPLRELHPRHGPHAPTSGTPTRARGSVRRTSTIDMVRHQGLDGPLTLVGAARDGWTNQNGQLQVSTEARCQAVVDFPGGRTLTTLTTSPVRPLDDLLGTRVSAGFRGTLTEVDASLVGEANLLYLLLDDLPGATLISGHAVAAGGSSADAGATGHGHSFPPDLCSGFATDGTIMSSVAESGTAPIVTGPPAPSLKVGDDPVAWHPTEPLPRQSMRRTRRIDVRPGALSTVDAMFRDSYVLTDGTETIIHEYTLSAEIDNHTNMIRHCDARPQVLPWVECPVAAASAHKLSDTPLYGLRHCVRSEFSGVSTCTHLNDMLRALEDVPMLLAIAADVE